MDIIPLPQRGAAFGWISFAFAGGGAIGMITASSCMKADLSLGVTYLFAAAVQGTLFLVLFFMKEPRRGSQDEALRDVVGEGQGEYGYHIERADLKVVLRKPVNLLFGAATVLSSFPPAVLTLWFVTFLMRNHGLAELPATQLTLVSFLGLPVGIVVGGFMADRAYKWKRSGRVVVMISTAALAPVFLVAALALPFKLIWFVPLMILANFFIIAGGPAIVTLSLEVNLPEHRGTISALLAICGNLSLGLAWFVPPLIADAMDGQYQLALIMTAAVYLPLIVIYLLINSRIVAALDFIKGILEERAEQIQKSQTKETRT